MFMKLKGQKSCQKIQSISLFNFEYEKENLYTQKFMNCSPIKVYKDYLFGENGQKVYTKFILHKDGHKK